MTNFAGFRHKPVDVTDEKTGEVKHYDRVDAVFVTDKQPDYCGLYAFEHKIEFEDLFKVMDATIEELQERLSTGKTRCIVETVPMKNGKVQVTEVHWLDALDPVKK